MTASSFDEALKRVLVHEGGYADHPADPGGATMRGVTQRVYDGWRRRRGVPVRSVRLIEPGEVEAIYRLQYWDAVRADDLPAGLDYGVFDAAVHSGPGQAAKWLQRALGVTADGQVGEATLAALEGQRAASVDRRSLRPAPRHAPGPADLPDLRCRLDPPRRRGARGGQGDGDDDGGGVRRAGAAAGCARQRQGAAGRHAALAHAGRGGRHRRRRGGPRRGDRRAGRPAGAAGRFRRAAALGLCCAHAGRRRADAARDARRIRAGEGAPC